VAGFDGTMLLVSHDRRFLEAVETTRSIQLG
jgi:ATPase subunit of ABC transporter with duplicated ATPase domains